MWLCMGVPLIGAIVTHPLLSFSHPSDPRVHQHHQLHGVRLARVSPDGPDRAPFHLCQLYHRPLGLHPPLPQRSALLLGVHLQIPPDLLQGLRV